MVTVEYVWLAMSLGEKGEGGTVVLRETLVPMLKSGRIVAFVSLLSIIGISLLFGDGVITPAISILSAVEGMAFIPGLEEISQGTIVIIAAINPYYAIKYLLENHISGFFLLSQVILCATGGEALFADMGHLGKLPIIRAWYLVFVALLLNYLGQGAFILQHPETKNVLFEMAFRQAEILYVPFLIISIFAKDIKRLPPYIGNY